VIIVVFLNKGANWSGNLPETFEILKFSPSLELGTINAISRLDATYPDFSSSSRNNSATNFNLRP